MLFAKIIDFSINGLCTGNRIRSQRTPTPHKLEINNCKLIDLVIRIELTQEILMARFSNFRRNSFILFRMLLYLITCFLIVTVSLLCRLQAVSKIQVSIYPYLISERKLNFWPCDRHRNETVSLRKYVTKYKIMHVEMDYRISSKIWESW